MGIALPEPTFHRRAAGALAYLLLAAVLACGYYVLGSVLFKADFVSLGLLFFSEKAALALHGAPPHLPNVGFVYPPLSYLIQLPFNDAFTAQAVLAGMIVAAIVRSIDRRDVDPALGWVVKTFIVFSPVTLFLATERYGELLFATLLAASVHYMTRFLREGYSLHLFTASTLLGTTFFIDFRSIFVMLLFVPAMALPYARASRAQAISIALTVIVPMAFFALAWSYVNWVFVGDPLAFVSGSASFFHTFTTSTQALAAAGNPLSSALLSAREIAFTLPITAPYFVGLFYLRGTARIPTVLIYLGPVMLVAMSAYLGVYAPSDAFVAVFVLTFAFALPQFRRSRVLVCVTAIGFVFSFASTFVTQEPEERAFARAVVGGAIVENVRDYRDLAGVLAASVPGDRILADDATMFPLVALSANPERFLLPYQYEFASALSNPRGFARFVVVARRKDDMIDSLYPDIERGRLVGYREVARSERFVAFERLANPQ